MPAPANVLLDQFQVLYELRKHQHLVPVLNEFAQHAGKGFELCTPGALPAAAGGAIQNQAWIAAGQPQPGQMGEHLHPPRAFPQGIVRLAARFEFLHGALPKRLVERRFFGGHPHVQDDLGALRQVVEHFRFQPPEHERRNQAPQPGVGAGVAGAFDSRAEIAAELLRRTEQARIDESKQRMQVHQIVLNRSAGGYEAKVGIQAASGLGPLGGRILDRLRLVQRHAVPVNAGQQVDVVLQQGHTS